MEAKLSPVEGTGVFALEAISRGTVILRIDDSRVVDDTHPLRPDAGDNPIHRDYLPDGTVVLMKSPEKYVNHSCDPNSYVYSVNRRRFLLAMHDIAAGREILLDYSLNAVNGDVWECTCGAGGCRGVHKCDFFALPPAVRLARLPYLDPWFATVHATRIEALLNGRP